MSSDWDSLADEYVRIDDDRKNIVYPTLSRMLENWGVGSVLDYGGGNGEFVEQCSQVVNADYWMYDPSERMRALASRRLENRGDVTVVDAVGRVPTEVDVSTMIAVWMGLRSHEDCVEVLRECGSVLSRSGRLAAAVTHPCFRSVEYRTFKTDFDPENYFDVGRQFQVKLDDGERSVTLKDTHWNLASMTSQLKEAGFVIEEIVELRDPKEESVGSSWMILVAQPLKNMPVTGK